MTSLPPRNPLDDDLLAPENSALVLVDFQPAQIYTSISSEPDFLVRNVVSLAKVGKLFDLPIVLSTAQVSAGLNGDTIPQLREQLVGVPSYDRTAINAWEDEAFVRAIEATGRRKLMIAGLWTEVCVAYPALSALEAGYQVYVVADACAGVDTQAHDTAIQRVVQRGAIPVTWLDVLFEFQRDWSRQEAYNDVVQIILQHTGGLGEGINFLFGMTSPAPTA